MNSYAHFLDAASEQKTKAAEPSQPPNPGI